MTDHTSHARQIAGQARREVAPADRQADQGSLRVHIAMPGAKVFLLPGRFRSDQYVATHIHYVVAMGAEKGEAHIIRNLGAIERNLREMGIDDAAIAAELRFIEGRVRAELWRQILMPDAEA